MNAEDVILALLVACYVAYPYSWKDGSDHAWRQCARRLSLVKSYEALF